MNNQICFERPTFNMYLFILLCVISYLIYFKISCVHENMTDVDLYSTMDKDSLYKTIINMKEELFNSKLKEQKCEISLQALKQTQNTGDIRSRLLNKIYDPLTAPDSIYSSGRINRYIQFQMVGYLSAGVGQQFPVFGRNKYRGNDKMEYYTINDSRNKVKIIIKTKNYNELYDGDHVNIPELGGDLIFTKYEIENTKYNPNY